MNNLKNFIMNKKNFQFFKKMKVFFTGALILILSVILYAVNVSHNVIEDSIDAESRPTQPRKKINRNTVGHYDIEKVADIIVRDGKNVSKFTAEKYAKWIYASSELHNVNPVLILSVMYVESNFDSKAQSPTGPIGLLQIAYTYHKEKTSRIGLFDPQNNINVGAQILAEYKGLTDTATLSRYYGGTAKKSTEYAKKVLLFKDKYESELMLSNRVKSI